MDEFGGRLAGFWRDNWLFLILMGAVLGTFLMLRTSASAVDSVAELDTLLHDGQPTLVELYSNT